MSSKSCLTCKQTKPEAMFYTGKDQCKLCQWRQGTASPSGAAVCAAGPPVTVMPSVKALAPGQGSGSHPAFGQEAHATAGSDAKDVKAKPSSPASKTNDADVTAAVQDGPEPTLEDRVQTLEVEMDELKEWINSVYGFLSSLKSSALAQWMPALSTIPTPPGYEEPKQQ